MDWTEKYRPQSLSEVVGNGPSVGRLKAWADSWRGGLPAQRAIILAGPPGTGKTSTALALARDMGWSVIELNASDARNADAIRRTATAGSLHQTFSSDGSFHAAGAGGDGGRKLILLDEADNLTERAGAEGLDDSGNDMGDRGGKAQIIETIRQSRQPIILIVNDLYALEKGAGAALKSLCEVLKFTRVNVRSIPAALRRIAQAEGLQVEPEVLEALAVKAEGDMRAAVRDFESISLGRTKVTRNELASLGTRDTTTSMFDLVKHILKGRKLDELRRTVWEVDATPEDIVLWVDENLAKEYRDPKDLVAGYEMLARADVFLGRTKSTQDYGLWGYAGELTTIGVMAVRQREYREFVPFGFPQWLSRMSRSRGMRQAKDELSTRLGRATHCSKRKSRAGQVEPFAAIFAADREFAIEQTLQLELEDEQVALLLGENATAKDVKDIRAAVTARQDPDAAKPPSSESEGIGASRGKPGAKKVPAPVDEPAKPPKPAPAAGQKGLFGF